MGYRKNDFPGNIAGSVFTKGSSDAIKPPLNHIFVAFTTLSATTFDATGGLVAEDENKYANTEHAAGDLTAGSETNAEGSGGLEVASTDSFPAGIDVYGQFTEIDVNSGSIIAYYARK